MSLALGEGDVVLRKRRIEFMMFCQGAAALILRDTVEDPNQEAVLIIKE